MVLSSRLVIIKASSLSKEFQERVAVAQYCSVQRFIKCHGLANWMDMHIVQQFPKKLEDISAAFMEKVHPNCHGFR